MTYLDLKKQFNIDVKKIEKFLNLLKEKNEVMNLTSITDLDEMIDKHIYDSLLITKAFDFNNKTILDVGSGGGFPGIPLAILYPNSNFVLVDATKKKVDYLNDVIKELELKNVKALWSRVELLIEKEKYDVVISRAFAPLSIYLELAASLTKINGNIIALKGANAREELKISNNAIKELSLSLNDVQEEKLNNGDKRINLIFNKKTKTKNKYPRKFSEIKKKPL